jgi:hypothetical protein
MNRIAISFGDPARLDTYPPPKGTRSMQPEPMRCADAQTRSAFLRAWRDEISLYRAAYGMGGLGLVLVSLLRDVVLYAGGAPGWLSYIAGGSGQLAFAWISIVATWRAAQKGRPGGRPYGLIAVGLAFAFVGIQFVLTAAWTGWSGLGELGVAATPGDILSRALIVAMGGNYAEIDQLSKALATFVN